jgi:hypothetical protein
MPPKAFADLGVDDGSGSGSSSDEEGGSGKGDAPPARQPAGGACRPPGRPGPPVLADPAPEELEALGFDGAAPLSGTVPEPEPGSNCWAWGTAAARDGGPAAGAPDDRAATVAAAAAMDAVALETAAARAAALAGKDDKKASLNFKQREKRKRDAGQQAGGHKNYVEEEKRVAREMGAL